MGETGSTHRGLVFVSGPACIDGERLTGRQRAIVSALAFHRETGCTTEVLVDAVWAGQAPKAARQSLQNQITRLRRRFGSELIQTEHDGYRIQAEVDVERFERGVAAPVDGPVDPASVPVLEVALGEWHGVPYADLTEFVPAEAERNRLIDLHARAQEQLVVARMVMGDHARAAAELTALVTEDPYRERRWRLLVLANHLAGRHADALATYDRAVARFATDLRARPSAVLTSLRDRIAEGEMVALEEIESVAVASPVVSPVSTGARHRGDRGRAERCRRRRLSDAR